MTKKEKWRWSKVGWARADCREGEAQGLPGGGALGRGRGKKCGAWLRNNKESILPGTWAMPWGVMGDEVATLRIGASFYQGSRL